MARYNFEYLSKLYDTQVIARGTGVSQRRRLNRMYGRGRWRKMKGKAIIQYDTG